MSEIKISTTTNLLDIEKLLNEALSCPNTPVDIQLARQRKHQFFKDPAIAQFFATISRRRPYTLVDWHNDWKAEEFSEYYGENLGGVSAVTFATSIANLAAKPSPGGSAEIRKWIADRHGLLKPYGPTQSRVRELAFFSFDPKLREPAALAGLIHDQEGFVRRIQSWRERLLDIRSDHQEDLFASRSAPRPVMEFLWELYQNGAEHGNKDAQNNLLPGVRSLSLRRHNAGSMTELRGFADGFPELEKYIEDWSRLNRGTAFFEVSVNDVGLGIIDRFVATRPEFAPRAKGANDRLELLLRILLTPESSDGPGNYEQAYSSKDIAGQERGSGRGLERALEAVRKLQGFVSLRTAEFWLCRGFPSGEAIGQTAMHQVTGGPFAPVVGTCFTALFPINLQA